MKKLRWKTKKKFRCRKKEGKTKRDEEERYLV